MQKVFGIEMSDVIIKDNQLIVVGRTYEDFTKNEVLYLKNLQTNQYKRVSIDSIFAYQHELEGLPSGLTAKIILHSVDEEIEEIDGYI